MGQRRTNRLVSFLLLFVLAAGTAFGRTHHKKRHQAAPAAASIRLRVVPFAHRVKNKRDILGALWKTQTFADSTEGDSAIGEDLTVRRAAVEALGPYNGTVIVADPKTGRILTIVNQKLAIQ